MAGAAGKCTIGAWGVRVSGNWRAVFHFEGGVDLIDYR
jgi:plasmid maintenance system killer protein